MRVEENQLACVKSKQTDVIEPKKIIKKKKNRKTTKHLYSGIHGDTVSICLFLSHRNGCVCASFWKMWRMNFKDPVRLEHLYENIPAGRTSMIYPPNSCTLFSAPKRHHG